MKEKITDKSLILEYGRALRKGSSETLIDLNDTLNIDFEFQIHNINDLVKEFNGVMPPNRISHYVLAIITKGEGRKTIGHYSFNIQPGMGMVFPKRIIHSTDRWSLDTSGYMLTFDESIFNETGFPLAFLQLSQLFKLSQKPYRLLNETTAKMAKALFVDLQNLGCLSEPFHKKILTLKLSELILLYQSAFQQNNSFQKRGQPIFDKFVELLESHFIQNKAVKFYADKLAVHPNHLNKVVHANTGFSVKWHIQNRIFQEAKYLLHATDMSVKEIAYSLGFSDNNHFNRQFKQFTNYTPKQYRFQKD